jgi:hypothetical protein
VDSKIVNKEIKKSVWPQLRDFGFNHFSQPSAWRHHADRIDVLNFQSFNSYNAEVTGCTTYSFSVNLGCYLKYIPPSFEPTRIKSKNELLLPQEFNCHFRACLVKGFAQPEITQADIWYIDAEGTYIESAIFDVSRQLESKAIPWFDLLSDRDVVLDVLLKRSQSMTELWGFGNNSSPIRHYYTGYAALSTGRFTLANHLELALASGCFDSVQDRLRSDIETASTTI